MNAAPTSKTYSRLSRAIQQAAGLILIYVILLFVLPMGQDGLSSSHLSMFSYRIIRFAVSVPTMLVWLAAFAGYATIRQYALALKDAAEAPHYDKLATGSAWLAWSLPISLITALLLSSLAHEWQAFTAASVILTNYVNLVLPLVAFSIMGVATRGLINQANLKLSLRSARAIAVLFLTAGVLYCLLTFRHFDLSNIGSSSNPYYLPIWLMVLTVIIPYLYAWFVGILATYEITMLSRRVQGLLYRRGLLLLGAGLATIITSSIALQYINGVVPRSYHLVLDAHLLVTVLFRVVGGVGFLLLTTGALRLKKIEEV